MRKPREGEFVLPLDNVVEVHDEGWEEYQAPNSALCDKECIQLPPYSYVKLPSNEGALKHDDLYICLHGTCRNRLKMWCDQLCLGLGYYHKLGLDGRRVLSWQGRSQSIRGYDSSYVASQSTYQTSVLGYLCHAETNGPKRTGTDAHGGAG